MLCKLFLFSQYVAEPTVIMSCEMLHVIPPWVSLLFEGCVETSFCVEKLQVFL